MATVYYQTCLIIFAKFTYMYAENSRPIHQRFQPLLSVCVVGGLIKKIINRKCPVS